MFAMIFTMVIAMVHGLDLSKNQGTTEQSPVNQQLNTSTMENATDVHVAGPANCSAALCNGIDMGAALQKIQQSLDILLQQVIPGGEPTDSVYNDYYQMDPEYTEYESEEIELDSQMNVTVLPTPSQHIDYPQRNFSDEEPTIKVSHHLGAGKFAFKLTFALPFLASLITRINISTSFLYYLGYIFLICLVALLSIALCVVGLCCCCKK